ncbi:MAG: SusC/RagA family TonB-linked outer membrane protein [Cyclobacteriaceae bacterium]
MMRILLLGLLLMAVILSVQAQDRSISGIVTSQEDNTPMPGVNVIVKDTGLGTVTDVNGQYQISVPPFENILVFTFIGYLTEEIKIDNQSTIDLYMRTDTQQLDEIVVTAIGIEREKRALGYSVETIKGDKLQQVSEPDPLRALQGKVPGVNISGSGGAAGSATRITIRGNSSLLGDNQPLFVVDGVPFNNESNSMFSGLTEGVANGSRIADIDPNNIASMTVLKGAAAAALYGSRAANGVVLITTKTGMAKSSKKGLEMTLNSSFGIENIANLPEYQNTYGTGTSFTYGQSNGSWGAPFIGTRPYADTQTIPHWYDGRAGMEAFWGTSVPYRAYPDNVKDLFRTGRLTDNSLSIQSGNEKATISATISNTLNQGYVPSTDFQRTSISVGANANLDNGFIIGGNVTYVNSIQHAVQGGVGDLSDNNPSAFSRALYLGRNWDVSGQPFQNPVDRGSEFMVGRGQADNPFWSYENSGYKSQTDRAIANFNIGYDITDWLNITYKVGANNYTQRQSDFIRPGSTGADGLGAITNSDVTFTELESNLLITITKDFTERFSFRGILGNNVNQRTRDAQLYQGTEYVVFDIDDIDNTNNVVPFGGDYTRRRLIGAFADFTLGYQDWAFLTITGRNDWSSTLPMANRSFFYPAVTGSVVLTEALGIQSQNLNNLRLRAAWSEVGNDTDPYRIFPIFLINSVYGIGATAQLPFQPTGGANVPGATLSNQERDPNLRPERTKEYEFGIDFSAFNNKLDLSVTYYNRRTVDQIAPVSLPQSTGFTSLLTNFGEVSNEGIEIGLGLSPIARPQGFQWHIYGTFTHNKNKVVSLAEGVDEITFGSRIADVATVLRPGQEYGLLRGTVNARDQDGSLLINPVNGQLIKALEPAIIGNPNPDFIVGISNTLSYKGFSLSAVVDWRQGGDFYSYTIQSLLGSGVTKFTEDREMNWIIPGVYGNPNTLEPYRDPETGAKYPNHTMVETRDLWFGESFAINAADEWNVYDATVIRLREAVLAYSLPAATLERTPFGAASISVSGRNLWFYAPFIPKYSNFDPEVNQFGNSNQQGIEFSATPTVRRFSVNISLTF